MTVTRTQVAPAPAIKTQSPAPDSGDCALSAGSSLTNNIYQALLYEECFQMIRLYVDVIFNRKKFPTLK